MDTAAEGARAQLASEQRGLGFREWVSHTPGTGYTYQTPMIMHAIPGIRKVCFHETLALLQSTVKQESSHGVIFTHSSFIKNPHSFLNTWTPIQD